MRNVSPLFTLLAAVIGLAACADPSLAGPKRPGAANPGVSATALPPINDTCAGAITLSCGTFHLSGSTETANPDYAFSDTTVACIGYREIGKDVVYRVIATAGDSIWITVNATQFDAALYLVTDCSNVQGSCVSGADSMLIGSPETLAYKFTSDGTYYLILDTAFPEDGGPWTGDGQLICVNQPRPSNDDCTTPILIGCGPFSLSGSTEFAINDYEFPSTAASCFGSRAQGKDVAYILQVQAGDSIWVNYNSSTDGAIYIVANCADVAGTCMTGKDQVGAGATELLRYRFDFSGTFYLILDSKDPGTFGNWTAIGAYVCPAPPRNSNCDGAYPLPCGPFSLSGNTQYANNDYYFPSDSLSCTGFRADGRDVTYRIYAHTGDSLWVNYMTTTDGSLYVVSDCADPVASCVAGEDSMGVGETETLRLRIPASGTYYLVLDSFGNLTSGGWTAFGALECPTHAVVDPTLRGLALGTVTPNPFRLEATLPFATPTRGHVRLRMLDLQGRVMRTLVDGEREAGTYQVRWDGRDDAGQLVRAGVYFVKLIGPGGAVVKRAIFVR